MKKAWIVALLISLLPLVAIGAISRAEILKQVESSMLVKGTIETNADGSVNTLVIDQSDKFPAGLVDFVRKQVLAWEFEPVLVDGKAMRARSPVSLRVVARAVGGGNYSIAIRNASFDGEPTKEGETLSSKRMDPPRYPELVARSGASGTVYVVVKTDKQGRVVDAVAEQVNLRTIGTAKEMEAWRKALADAALNAARKWTFTPPVHGETADDESWSARVPCDFKMDSRATFVYGKWEQYIPGPRQSIPWSDEDRPGFSPDSLAAGGVYMIGQNKGPKLLTALDGT
jgi:hypothetical protein